MLELTLTNDRWPDLRVRARMMDGPEMFDLQGHGARGAIIYDVLRAVLLDWENMPLVRGGVSEKFELAALRQIDPGVAGWLVTEIYTRSTLTEDEKGNC